MVSAEHGGFKTYRSGTFSSSPIFFVGKTKNVQKSQRVTHEGEFRIEAVNIALSWHLHKINSQLTFLRFFLTINKPNINL